jgi:hypothetical protein
MQRKPSITTNNMWAGEPPPADDSVFATVLVAAVLLAATFLSSCGGTATSTLPGNALIVGTHAVTLPQGGSWTFTANVAVTWSVREGAAGGTIRSDGVYTAPQVQGTFHVVATSQSNHPVSDAATVTVLSVRVAILPPAIGLTPGQNFNFSAETLGTIINPAATWSIQEGTAGGTITGTGQYTAPNTLGTFHVIATSVADPTKSSLATVTVVSVPAVFRLGGSMMVGRVFHSGTLLNTGEVLVAGGIEEVTDDCGCGSPLSSAELFDLASETFTLTGQMRPRASHTATKLSDGRS